MVRGVVFSEGHGLQLLQWEHCGINVKEEGRASVHRVVQCLRFAKGSCKELRETEMSERERGSWWLLGKLYLPKTEVCARRGHRGFSWVTEENMVGWEVELYERNVELILTQDVAWYPVSGVTSTSVPPVEAKRKRGVSFREPPNLCCFS